MVGYYLLYLYLMKHIRTMDKIDYTLTINLNEVKYDVKFDSWHKGDTTDKSIAYDNDDAEYWLVREIDSAIADIEGELAWAVPKEEQGESATDAIDVIPLSWAIHLQFSPSWRGSIRAMNSLAHRYVVAKVLYRWYHSADLRTQAGDHLAEANDYLERLYMIAREDSVSLKPWRL